VAGSIWVGGDATAFEIRVGASVHGSQRRRFVAPPRQAAPFPTDAVMVMAE
jgi:hypothetical protein